MKILKPGKTLKPLKLEVTCKFCTAELMLTDPKDLFARDYIDKAGFPATSYHYICPECNFCNNVPDSKIDKDVKARIQPRV